MGLFEHFPYTNFHDLNLDVILNRVKTAEASAVEAAEDAAGSHQQAAEAVATANQAVSSAQQAINTANAAVTTADQAVTTAQEAVTNSQAAQTAAEASQAAAETAQEAAEEAAATGPSVVYKMLLSSNSALNPNQLGVTFTTDATQAQFVNHILNGSARFLLRDEEYNNNYSNCYLVSAELASGTNTYNCTAAAIFNDSNNMNLYQTTVFFTVRPRTGSLPMLITTTGHNRRTITTSGYSNT